ncbi:MAG: DNA polymerase I [Caldiserica bacterium]|jgi:DNA polymerase-1|nr:DNA polymerase I [Caldisericota bacterium]MDH7563163.1 DNA polymerase I [Caldisericota bacterium]
MKEKDRIVLVDGNSILYRTYFALPSLTTSQGIPTGGVYGLTNILFRLFEEVKPDYIAFSFDRRGPTFRHLEFKEYKAQRPKTPSDLITQVALAKDLAAAFQIPVFEKEGYEADDCIATLARKAVESEKKVIILSGDLDSLQLVSQNILLMVPLKGISQIFVYDEEAVIKRYGLKPSQMVDYKALVGDPSDNIPRIPGIGEKTARDLLSRYGSIEGIYAHLSELSPKIRETLENFQKQVEQNRRLSKLVDDLDLEIHWEKLKTREPDSQRLLELFSRLEFKTLIKKFSPTEKRNLTEVKPLSSWAKPTEPCSVFLLPGEPAVLALATKDEVFAGEIDPSSQALSLFSSFLPIPGPVSQFLEDESAPKWTHDYKSIYKFFKAKGLNIRGIQFDTLLASYLLNSSRSSHSLEQIFLEREKQPLFPEEGKITPEIKAGLSASAIKELTPILKGELEDQGLFDLLSSLELPLSEVLGEMEIRGIRISLEVLSDLRQEAEKRLRNLESEIYSLCGCDFNIASPKQLSFVLFEKLGLSRGKKTKTGYSTDISVLESLKGMHPVIEKIIEHRELSKLKNTYIDSLPLLADSQGRVHTTFLQTSTSTGRLSSVNPNLQNIPIRSEFGGRIRKAFVASSPQHLLLSADYSQIELRILAHLSGDKKLQEVFLSDGDIHTNTACYIFKVREDQVTSEMRRVAKTVNFGIIYGMSSFGLSQAISVPVEEAQAYIDAFFLEHSGVREFLDRVLEEGRKEGFVRTILGRRRYLPDLNSPNKKLSQQAERMAINAPVQGSAADIIKIAMIRLHDALKKEGLKSHLVLQVHDELVLDCPQEEKERVGEMVREIMSRAFPLSVPLKVDLKVGKNWFEMEPLNA